MRKLVAVVMGSKSDYSCVKNTLDLLKEFQIPYEVKVLSAHRCTDETVAYAKSLRENGFKVVIAAAGKSAALAGVIAGSTTLPVLGIPIKSSTLDGLDSLLSTVQMPAGIPVASLAIGDHGAKNAAIFALSILAINDDKYQEILLKYRKDMKEDVLNVELDD